MEICSKARENQRTNPKSEIEAEAYLNGTSQVPIPEDAQKDAHIQGRSK